MYLVKNPPQIAKFFEGEFQLHLLLFCVDLTGCDHSLSITSPTIHDSFHLLIYLVNLVWLKGDQRTLRRSSQSQHSHRHTTQWSHQHHSYVTNHQETVHFLAVQLLQLIIPQQMWKPSPPVHTSLYLQQ